MTEISEAAGGVATSEPSASSRGGAPPYRLYGLMFVAFLIVRFGDLAIQDSEFAVQAYNSRLCVIGLPLLAIVLSFIAGMYLKNRVSNVIAWLLCGFVGGGVTLLTNASVGAAIGFVVGGFVVFGRRAESPQSLTGATYVAAEYLMRTVVPAAGAGFVTGAIWVVCYVQVGQVSHIIEFVSIWGTLLAGLVVFTVGMRCTQSNRRWYGWLVGSGLFLLFYVVGSVGVWNFDMNRRCAAMPHVNATWQSVASALLPASASPWQGTLIKNLDRRINLYRVDSLRFSESSSDADIAYARGLPLLSGLSFMRGSVVTDCGFQQLDCRRLRWFTCQGGTKLTDASARRLDMSRLESLTLEGPNFTDAAVEQIGSAKALYHLSLKNSQVTSAGLQPLSPATPLWQLDLSGTQVDDRVFALLGPVRSVNLSRTKVTGSGLKEMMRLTGSVDLDLSDTALEQHYLADLVPTDDPEDPTWNPLVVHGLRLRGLPLTEESVVTISKIDTLGFLDVTGCSVSQDSLNALAKLPLVWLGVDGDRLTSENVNWFAPTMEFTLTYDAATSNLAEITQHIEELYRARSRGPGRNGEFRLRILRLAVDGESVRMVNHLWELTAHMNGGVILEDAVLPNGDRRTYKHVNQLADDFPELAKQ